MSNSTRAWHHMPTRLNALQSQNTAISHQIEDSWPLEPVKQGYIMFISKGVLKTAQKWWD